MNDDLIIHDLFLAAETGDVPRLQELLDAHPGLAGAENKDGLTLLGYAAHFGHSEAVRLLLGKGADPDAVSHSTVSYIPSNTALHAAIAGARSREVISLLLQSGASTTIADSSGGTCLHSAAFHDDSTDILAMLMEYGADPGRLDSTGHSAYSLARMQGNDQAAACLKAYEEQRSKGKSV